MPENPSYQVAETDVEIQTPDGVCNAAYFRPSRGAHPGVLIWPDAFGLRPTFREIGRRLAADGYSVLVPNPYYRISPAPLDTAHFSFQDPADMAKLHSLMGPLDTPGVIESDAGALLAFLDAQPEVDVSRKIGTQGYCLGGRMAFRTAAALPGRTGAGASFHGGGLVTGKPDSPHLLASKIKAHMYVAVAASDDERQPDAKVTLQAAFAAARVPAEIEVYPGTRHGWCIRDMPAGEYNRPDADRAWEKLLTLYRENLG